MYKQQTNQGIILVLCLILVVVLEGISLAVMSTTVTNSKAIKYSNAQMDAQQKADFIANSAYAALESQRIAMYTTAKDSLASNPTTDDLLPGTSPTLSSAPTMPTGMTVISTQSNATAKQWWKTNAQQYPNADALHALPAGTYALTNGTNPTDTVASYVVFPAGFTTVDGYNVRTFKIVAYATDSTGKTAATREKYYKWSNNCKTTPGMIMLICLIEPPYSCYESPLPGTTTCR